MYKRLINKINWYIDYRLPQRLLAFKRKRLSEIYTAQFKSYLERAGQPAEIPVEGEDAYMKLWGVFGAPVEPYSYRFYRSFMGDVPYIIPEDIGHSYIEHYLNPVRFRDFYADKNAYNRFYRDSDLVPHTLIRRMNGGEMAGADYQPLSIDNVPLTFRSSSQLLSGYFSGYEKVIFKPTIDSNSGMGVKIFYRQESLFRANDGTELTPAMLEKAGSDWAIQEVIDQHELLSRFNPSSLNTLRLCTYRSVIDERVHLTCAALRVGAEGKEVDNGHSGGRFVKVSISDGRIDKRLFSPSGDCVTTWNGIDFSSNQFSIPEWQKVVRFAKDIASRNPHARLLAFDVTLTREGMPMLVECNNMDFSFWIPQLLGYDVLGGETETVIQFCLRQIKNGVERPRFQLL